MRMSKTNFTISDKDIRTNVPVVLLSRNAKNGQNIKGILYRGTNIKNQTSEI